MEAMEATVQVAGPIGGGLAAFVASGRPITAMHRRPDVRDVRFLSLRLLFALIGAGIDATLIRPSFGQWIGCALGDLAGKKIRNPEMGKVKKQKPVTRQPQSDDKSAKKKRKKKKKLQKYLAPVPTKDTAMPIQFDSNANDDSSSGETKPEKIQKLLKPDAFLFTRLRDATDHNISRCKLVVYGLAWDTMRETLVSAFESYREIEDCNVIFDRVMGKTKGYGFIQFKTRREAAKALKQPRKKIGNLMSRTADLVTSKDGILLMIGAPSTVLVDLKVDLSLRMLSLKVHMGLESSHAFSESSHGVS